MADTDVRRATPADAGLVGRLLFDFNTEFETETPSAAEFTARFARLLGDDDVVVLLAGGADPVGFAYLTLRPSPYFDGPLAQLEELYVVPRLRDQGIGTALLQAALDLCRGRSAGELHINVDEDRHRHPPLLRAARLPQHPPRHRLPDAVLRDRALGRRGLQVGGGAARCRACADSGSLPAPSRSSYP